MRFLWTVLLMGVVIAPTHAADYGVWGFGTRSCGAWVADKQDTRFAWKPLIDMAWVEGFLTAMDRADPAINVASHKTDADAMPIWMDNYCAAHPLDSIATAAEAFALTLRQRH